MTTLPWFRMYHRIIDDPKLKLLAFEDRWHFVALCCLTANGTLAVDDEDLKCRMVAVALGVQLRELDEIRRRLVVVNLIGPDMVPIAWEELQFQSDNSTARVQKFREKQRRNKAKRCGNVSVTAQETDEDTETDKKETLRSCASDDARELVDDWNELAGELGLPKVAKLTDQRRRHIKTGLRRNTLDEWRAAFGAIRRSRFLQGDNKTGWKANFDFMLQPSSFARLIEGYYDGKVQ